MNSDSDRRARFGAVAEDVYEPLQRYLRRRASLDDADELLDDVLLTIWRRLDDVPSDAALPWAYAVAKRALANRRRSEFRHGRLLARLAAQAHSNPPTPPQDDAHPELAAALAALPESDREVLRLWAWEDLEPRQIALVLDSTPNAAALRLSRAKKKLAAQFARQDRARAGHKGSERIGDRGS